MEAASIWNGESNCSQASQITSTTEIHTSTVMCLMSEQQVEWSTEEIWKQTKQLKDKLRNDVFTARAKVMRKILTSAKIQYLTSQ